MGRRKRCVSAMCTVRQGQVPVGEEELVRCMCALIDEEEKGKRLEGSNDAKPLVKSRQDLSASLARSVKS